MVRSPPSGLGYNVRVPSPLPLSRSQIEKLGKRLVAGERPDPADLLLLNELQIAYRDVLTDAVERVEAAVPYSASSRVKTQGTTLDKLRLNGGSWLSSIQDLAGMRIVADVTRDEQDRIVQRLVDLFLDAPKPSRVIDRRASPSSGYRAVHVVVFPHGVQVEIQVRTRLQHQWAEMFERLADRLGRGIRYGQAPVLRGHESIPDEGRAAIGDAAVALADSLSVVVDAYEQEDGPHFDETTRATRRARMELFLEETGQALLLL